MKTIGLIISEYLPDVPAFKYNFPKRNKLIAGIAEGVVITQACENSGSLITANHSLTMNKPTFTFPYSINEETYKGNNLILTQGAKCILSYKDILKNYPNFISKNEIVPMHQTIPDEYKAIYNSLKTFPCHIDTLRKITNIQINELQYKLTLMELNDLICKLPNNYWCKK